MAIRIFDRSIGEDHPPFIIAEMSGNHNRSLGRALELVEAAARAGVDAVKIQTYTADTMTLDLAENEFVVTEPDSLWKGRSLYSLYDEAHTPWEWHKEIFEKCRQLGILGFSTPFDDTSVDFLEGLNVPCYKIASQENTDIPLIKKAAATGKPLLISTGMATLDELEESVRAARDAGCRDLILLKCTSTYPASPADTHLLTIPDLRDRFEAEVGVSDHTLGIGVSIAAVALGASVIEKHFTLRRSDGGVDAAFSTEPEEMRSLVQESRKVRQAVGTVRYEPTEREQASLKYRRSLYIAKDVKAGDLYTPTNVRAVRPGLGLPPKFYTTILGKRAARDAKKGTPISWDMIEGR